MQAVPHLDEWGRAPYREFLAAPDPRAFVLAPGGTWAWSAEAPTSELASAAALQDCQRQTEQRCVPYAEDDAVAFATLKQIYTTSADTTDRPGVRGCRRLGHRLDVGWLRMDRLSQLYKPHQMGPLRLGRAYGRP